MTALLTAVEAARFAGVSKSTLWSWVASGRFPRPIKLGERCTRWSAHVLEAWIADGAPPVDRWVAKNG